MNKNKAGSMLKGLDLDLSRNFEYNRDRVVEFLGEKGSLEGLPEGAAEEIAGMILFEKICAEVSMEDDETIAFHAWQKGIDKRAWADEAFKLEAFPERFWRFELEDGALDLRFGHKTELRVLEIHIGLYSHTFSDGMIKPVVKFAYRCQPTGDLLPDEIDAEDAMLAQLVILPLGEERSRSEMIKRHIKGNYEKDESDIAESLVEALLFGFILLDAVLAGVLKTKQQKELN